jgi:hypothetical protein
MKKIVIALFGSLLLGTAAAAIADGASAAAKGGVHRYVVERTFPAGALVRLDAALKASGDPQGSGRQRSASGFHHRGPGDASTQVARAKAGESMCPLQEHVTARSSGETCAASATILGRVTWFCSSVSGGVFLGLSVRQRDGLCAR